MRTLFIGIALFLALMRADASAGGDAMLRHFLSEKVKKATERARLVLKHAKQPKLAHEVRHRYEDKFLLAESLTASAIASQLNHFAFLGVNRQMLERLQGWTAVSNNLSTSPVLLKLQVQERCHFLRKETREVDSDRAEVTEVRASGSADVIFTKKQVRTVEEFFWRVDVEYKLSAQKGVAVEEEMVILARHASTELTTAKDENPRKGRREVQAEEIDISWLLKSFSTNTSSSMFSINRDGARCATPYRNPEVEQARDFFKRYSFWAASAEELVRAVLQLEPNFDAIKAGIDGVSLDTMFVPVLPLFQEELTSNVSGEGSGGLDAESMLLGMSAVQSNGTSLLSTMDMTKLLAEEFRILTTQRDKIKSSMSGMINVATEREAVLVMTLAHAERVAKECIVALRYIEGMMEQQLVAAIGKEISPADFAEYMGFHSRRLFSDAYLPVPFTYAVRRSAHHSPEGTLSIESSRGRSTSSSSEASTAIATMLAYEASSSFIHMPLSASSTVTIFGDRYLHGWLTHQFRGKTEDTLQLAMKAKANQFSSFIVVVGRITSATSVDAKYAAIVQNKDEITIPLELSTIPAPQEFEEAIESLSPVQEEFARAFRSMQLESTLFGVVTIQIKPQLEKVLNLTADSLTKNIKLTQDLMQLFIKYQIPTDLLSYDATSSGDGDYAAVSSPQARLAAVKEHVAAMMAMIDVAKNEELEAHRQKALYEKQASAVAATELSLGSFARCGSTLSVYAFTHLGSSLSLRSLSHMGKGISMIGAARFRPSDESLDSQEPPLNEVKGMETQIGEAPSTDEVKGTVSGEESVDGTVEAADAPSATRTQEARSGSRDYTRVPTDMNDQFERLDVDAAVRPAILKPGDVWSKKAQEALLANAKTRELRQDQQEEHKAAAFHLLDALTKSGALAIYDASLHVVVAAAHGFDKDIIETVVQDNVNPIEKVERSMLIMASTVHQQPVSNLVASTQQERVRMASPMLFAEQVPSGTAEVSHSL